MFFSLLCTLAFSHIVFPNTHSTQTALRQVHSAQNLLSDLSFKINSIIEGFQRTNPSTPIENIVGNFLAVKLAMKLAHEERAVNAKLGKVGRVELVVDHEKMKKLSELEKQMQHIYSNVLNCSQLILGVLELKMAALVENDAAIEEIKAFEGLVVELVRLMTDGEGSELEKMPEMLKLIKDVLDAYEKIETDLEKIKVENDKGIVVAFIGTLFAFCALGFLLSMPENESIRYETPGVLHQYAHGA